MSKYAQEMIAMKLGERYEIPSVALRYSIVQGPRQSFYNAYSGACRIFSLSYYTGKSPTIYEDGNQVRDFVNIHDVVDANILAMTDNRCVFGVYCVGGGKAITVKEFDRIVAKVFGKDHLLPRIPGEYRFGDTRHACSDIAKLRRLGWNPRRTAEESVREYREYLESQKDIDNIVEQTGNQMKALNVVRSVKRKLSPDSDKT
jgi:dTDP-L-rhamnose 4-epimerase